MRMYVLAVALLVLAFCPAGVSAAEVSSDKMLLDWQTSKVWLSNGELCVAGTFTNKRDDLTVTKLNDFHVKIFFTKEDGSAYQFEGRPIKLPMCKIPASGTKKLTLNFGKFDGQWKSWVTSQTYVFTYINGSRW